jgi:Uncharacterised protein family (UPF0236)
MDTRILDVLEACYGEELSLLREDLGALEEKMSLLVREWGRGLLQRVVAQGSLGYQGSGRACACGGWSRFVGYRRKNLHTTVGWIEVRRAYYYCSVCGTGVSPYDQASGLGREALSVGLAKACCTVAVGSSFSESSRLMEALFGQKVSANTIERLVHHVGSAWAAQQRQNLEKCLQTRHPPTCAAPPKRLYLAADGTTVHERDGWHESKVGCLRWQDGQGVCHQSYVGGFEDAQQFGQFLWWQACRCGLREAEEVVYLGDGAAWVRGLQDRHWRRAVFIVDWYHAQEHIWDCAQVLWGEGTQPTTRWGERYVGWLWEGRTRKVLRELAQQHQRHRGRKRKAIEDLRRYIQVNEEQMRYDVFRARGYSIGSGMVEGACKHVVGDRLKRSGMIWSRAGSSATLALRICWLNHEWDQLWQQKPLAA